MSLCACGCGNDIVVKQHHSWTGTPKYLLGHNSKGENNPRRGKHHTDESKKLICEKKLGTIPWNKGTTGLQEAWNKGEHTPDDVKLKQSNARLGKIPWNKGLTDVQVAWNKGLKSKIPAWNKGVPPTRETRDKIAAALRGRSNPAQSERMKLMVGENSPNWKGGISIEPYCCIWKVEEYKDYIKYRDGYKCLNPCCSSKNKTDLNLHHINYNKKACNRENLITLCRSCNCKANTERNWHEAWYTAILNKRYKYSIERAL